MKPVLKNLHELKTSIERLASSHAQTKSEVDKMKPEVEELRKEFDRCRSTCVMQKDAKHSKELESLRKRLKKLYQEKGPGAALDLALEFRVKFKDFWDYWYLLGYYYNLNDQTDRAIEYLRKSIQMAPSRLEPRCGLLFVLFYNDLIEKAFDELSQMVVDVPLVPCHKLYGLLGRNLIGYSGKRDFGQVIDTITHPEEPDCTPCVRAYLHLCASDRRSAVVDLEGRKPPTCKEFALLQTAVLGAGTNREQFLQSVEVLNLGIEMDGFTFNVAVLLARQFEGKEECEALEHYVQRCRTEFLWGQDAEETRGRFLEALGHQLSHKRVAECRLQDIQIDLFREAAEKHSCPTLQAGLLYALTRSKRFDESVTEASHAISSYPDSPRVIACSALALAEAGKVTDASALIDASIGRTDLAFEHQDLILLKRAAEKSCAGALAKISEMLGTKSS